MFHIFAHSTTYDDITALGYQHSHQRMTDIKSSRNKLNDPSALACCWPNTNPCDDLKMPYWWKIIRWCHLSIWSCWWCVLDCIRGGISLVDSWCTYMLCDSSRTSEKCKKVKQIYFAFDRWHIFPKLHLYFLWHTTNMEVNSRLMPWFTSCNMHVRCPSSNFDFVFFFLLFLSVWIDSPHAQYTFMLIQR